MKKICITLLMMVALTVSLSTYAQDNNGESSKANTEQVEKKSGKACCGEKKDKACDEKKDKACCEKKDKPCCAQKDKNAKPSAGGNTTAEKKSCGKKS